MVKPSKEERNAWPEHHRPCVKCKEMKHFCNFHKHKDCWMGINTVCKSCREPLSKLSNSQQSWEYRLWHGAKSRSKIRGIEFSISLEEVLIPEHCPILGIKLERLDNDTAASLDRIDPTKGYISGNVWVISNKANRMKSDASLEELHKFGKWACEVTW